MPVNFAPSFSDIMNFFNLMNTLQQQQQAQSQEESQRSAQTGFASSLLQGLQPRPAELAQPMLAANAAPLSPQMQAPMTVGPKPMSPLGQPQRFPGPMTTTQPDFRQALLQSLTQYPQMLPQVPGAMDLLQPPQAQPFEPQWFGTPGAGIYATTPKGGLEQKLAAPPPTPKEPPDLVESEELVDGIPTYVYRHPKTREIVKIGGLVAPSSRGTSGKTPVSQELEVRQEQLRKKGEELRTILENPLLLKKRAAELFPKDKDKLAKTVEKISGDLKQVEADSSKVLERRSTTNGDFSEEGWRLEWDAPYEKWLKKFKLTDTPENKAFFAQEARKQ